MRGDVWTRRLFPPGLSFFLGLGLGMTARYCVVRQLYHLVHGSEEGFCVVAE